MVEGMVEGISTMVEMLENQDLGFLGMGGFLSLRKRSKLMVVAEVAGKPPSVH
jgi:hypothetical protein